MLWSWSSPSSTAIGCAYYIAYPYTYRARCHWLTPRVSRWRKVRQREAGPVRPYKASMVVEWFSHWPCRTKIPSICIQKPMKCVAFTNGVRSACMYLVYIQVSGHQVSEVMMKDAYPVHTYGRCETICDLRTFGLLGCTLLGHRPPAWLHTPISRHPLVTWQPARCRHSTALSALEVTIILGGLDAEFNGASRFNGQAAGQLVATQASLPMYVCINGP